MGLDMYLYARKYESCGSWEKDYEEKKEGFYAPELKEFQIGIEVRDFLSKEVLSQIGYWRKANAIHNWFVEECADGFDKCQKIWVSVEKVKELRNLVNRVLENHELAPKLLPTCDGFFFGSTKYDEGYFEDLEYTKDLLDKVIVLIDEHPEYDIVYEASW